MLSRPAGRRPHLEVRRGAVILVDSSPTEKPVGATCTHKHIRTHWSSRGVAVLTSHAQLPTNGKYAWSTNYSASDPPMRRTADHKQTAHMRCRVPRSRTHQTKEIQRRAILSVVPRPTRSRRLRQRRAPPASRCVCSGRWWSRCSRSSALPTSRSSPTPVPAPALRSTSARRTVEGAHAAQHARLAVINMLHKLIPQLCAQVRPHLSGEE